MSEIFSLSQVAELETAYNELGVKIRDLKTAVLEMETSDATRTDRQWKSTRVWKRARSAYLKFHRLGQPILRRTRRELPNSG